MAEKFKKKRRFTRRKVCAFCADNTLVIDYKRPDVLSRFISDRGKIMPSRISGVCAKHQRSLSTAIKRARHIAFVPYSQLESF